MYLLLTFHWHATGSLDSMQHVWFWFHAIYRERTFLKVNIHIHTYTDAENFFGQILQWYGLSPLWMICLCLMSMELWAKHLLVGVYYTCSSEELLCHLPLSVFGWMLLTCNCSCISICFSSTATILASRVTRLIFTSLKLCSIEPCISFSMLCRSTSGAEQW